MIDRNERKNTVLRYTIYHYICTGRPVASHTLTENYGLSLSSATLRNCLAELEQEGFLHQPHTSAGRIPTDKGYRCYIDHLMEIQRLAMEEQQTIRREYLARFRDLEKVWIHTCRLLATVSRYIGFVFLSPDKEKVVKHFELIRWNTQQILGLVIFTDGTVARHLILQHHQLGWYELQYLTNILNDLFIGMSFKQISQQIVNRVVSAELNKEETWLLVKEIVYQLIGTPPPESTLFLEGADNIPNFSDTEDYENICRSLQILQNKDFLVKLLKEELTKFTVKSKPVNIALADTPSAANKFPGLSTVSAVCYSSDKLTGLLGILGPKRMDYGRMAAIVDFVNRLVNKTLPKLGGL